MEGVTKKSEVDRISALPDLLVQHILSFLPSTKEAIRTGILSKRWKDQWAHVPVLILDSYGMPYAEKFSSFTENVLLTYDSSKIEKFCIDYGEFNRDSNLSAKIHFATRRNVEQLILKCYPCDRFNLPEFVFEHTPLVKLHTVGCALIPKKTVNWGRLEELSLSCTFFPKQAIESVLFGSPSLKSLELRICFGFDKLVISSNSLKRFLLRGLRNTVLEISCPNLEELTVWGSDSRHIIRLSNHVIENVLSGSLSLKSLDLRRCDGLDKLVIASESLRGLVLKELKASVIDISCPNIKELELEDVKDVRTVKLKN